MIAKITKGSCFGGLVRYLLGEEKRADILACDGVRAGRPAAEDFAAQTGLNPRVSKPVCHISLDFSVADNPTNEQMVRVALDYLARMGVQNTQYLIVRHNDREHPHLHIAYNRVDYDGRTITDRNDRFRSERICKELTTQYGLYFAKGKEAVKRDRLRKPDKTKYAIYDALVKQVPRSHNWAELQQRLRAEGVGVGFKTKGATEQVEGVRFTMNELTFNGSKVDRQFSYSKIDYALRQNAYQQQQRSTTPLGELFSTSASVVGSLWDTPPYNDPEEFLPQYPKRKRRRTFKL